VDDPLALELGRAYGFPKERAAVRVQAGAWSCTALADEGRTLAAARGPGAFLLVLPRIVLARGVVLVHLPSRALRTRFRFQAIRRAAPVVGLASSALRRWALGTALFPLGIALQGFAFILDPPEPW
jgi:hypothetical protein